MVRLYAVIIFVLLFSSCCVYAKKGEYLGIVADFDAVIKIDYVEFFPANLEKVIGQKNIQRWLYTNRYNDNVVRVSYTENVVSGGALFYSKILEEIRMDLEKCRCGLKVEYYKGVNEKGYLSFSLK